MVEVETSKQVITGLNPSQTNVVNHGEKLIEAYFMFSNIKEVNVFKERLEKLRTVNINKWSSTMLVVNLE